MAVQTTYNVYPDEAVAGFATRVKDSVSALNEESTAIPFGVFVKKGTAARSMKNLAAVTDTVLGLAKHKHLDSLIEGVDGLPADQDHTVVTEGECYALAEEAMSVGDSVYARCIVAGSEVYGAVRNDADGTANVWTVTPTATNDADYGLNIHVRTAAGKSLGSFSFHVTADASATATEICDAFRTAMQANATFDALVTSSGTATLVLTAADSFNVFDVEDGGDNGAFASITETTAGAPDCVKLENVRVMNASVTEGNGSSNLIVKLKFSFLG